MMISSGQWKKWLFRIIIVLGIIIIGWFSYKKGSSLIFYWKNKDIRESQKKIEVYESKIKTLNITGTVLSNKIKILNRQIDSLKQTKQQVIYVKYEEKVNIARRNIAMEHAKWMDSVLTKLKYNSGTK